jgi:hypothetical protein
MKKFDKDFIFTKKVHDKLAKKIIYEKLNWQIQELNINIAKSLDVNNAVDRFAYDKNSKKIITIQERFREKKYFNYSDFTIRYKREKNNNTDRINSEFFKLDCDYFVYGIIDESKENVDNSKKFLKFVVIDVFELKNLFKINRIVINDKSNSKKCIFVNNVLTCPVIYNKDDSSSFVPIDVFELINNFFDSKVILKQEGFN